ncbi:MAG: GTPase [Elusimicrobiota bacterium]
MSVIVERDNIGIFGKMNSGKSSLLNLVSMQEASIVDKTPGTTADTKLLKQEIHGMGPVCFYDTAGIDEQSALGGKKKNKVLSDLKECDLVLLLIDPSTSDFGPEEEILAAAGKYEKQLLVIYNIFKENDAGLIPGIEEKLRKLQFYKKIKIRAVEESFRTRVINFILDNYKSKNSKRELIPFLRKDRFYVLVIPMDEETPGGRYLRPQAMTEEFITRNWAYPVSYRLDLKKARSVDVGIRKREKKRFQSFMASLGAGPDGVITDSQAIDVLSKWVEDDIMLSTFSILMINYFSRGRLADFAEGAKALEDLKKGDRVLIAEACNHSRIGEDIGTVQIPRMLRKRYPGLIIEHNFGKEFWQNENLSKYSLIIHCGGCMISAQKLAARLTSLDASSIPYTNYGIFLAYMRGRDVLRRTLLPWNIAIDRKKKRHIKII